MRGDTGTRSRDRRIPPAPPAAVTGRARLEVELPRRGRPGLGLEIDAFPDRLDLKDEHARKAIAAGVKLVIDSDAHQIHHLRYPNDFGVGVARRAWATTKDVINTKHVDQFLACLKGDRGKRRAKRTASRRNVLSQSSGATSA